MTVIKIASWNVAGLRAISKKDEFKAFLSEYTPDILCMQETKASVLDADKIFQELGFQHTFLKPCILPKEKSNGRTGTGYSGVAILSKIRPLRDMSDMFHDIRAGIDEGRIVALEYDTFVLVTVYTPNSGSALERLMYRVEDWDRKFEAYMIKLAKHYAKKSIIVIGDLNCAHKEIDIHSPSTNAKSAGFTPQERASFDGLLSRTGYVDAYRKMHPDTQVYTYWSNFNRSREKNKGWRIDYALVKRENLVKNIEILDHVRGSDHCPILLTLKGDI